MRSVASLYAAWATLSRLDSILGSAPLPSWADLVATFAGSVTSAQAAAPLGVDFKHHPVSGYISPDAQSAAYERLTPEVSGMLDAFCRETTLLLEWVVYLEGCAAAAAATGPANEGSGGGSGRGACRSDTVSRRCSTRLSWRTFRENLTQCPWAPASRR